MAWFHKVYILSLLGSALMEDRIYKLVVSYGKIAPDSYLQQAILINGQFPGPKITAKKNDTSFM